jgi:hypothetical protein
MKNMKKIATLFMFACAALWLGACEEDTDKFIVSETKPVVLSALAIDEIELDPVNIANPIVTFNWSTANYGQQTTVNYKLEFSSNAAFTNPSSVSVVNSVNAITLSVAELNTAAGNAGLPAFAWNTIYARVVSSLGAQNSLPVSSNVITFRVYPYFNYVFKDYYLVGDATQPGWNNNNNNPPLFRDSGNSKLYTYTGFFNAGQFKVLEVKGLWQPQWGTNDGSTIAVNPGGGSDPGTFPLNNNPISTSGFYTFTINYQNNTYSFVPYTGSTSTAFTSISVQGTATSTIALTQSSFDSHLWFSNSVRLVPGNVKFLDNNGGLWGATTEFSGTSQLNGASIPVVVEDDYDIWFNDLTGKYIMIPLNL